MQGNGLGIVSARISGWLSVKESEEEFIDALAGDGVR
jgi:hypothetical protein